MLTTERLVLEPLDGNDEQGFVALYSDPLVCKFAPHFPLTETEAKDKMHGILFALRMTFVPSHFLVIKSKAERTFVGTCNFRSGTSAREAEIVFHLLPAFWGRGYATEAVRALLDYGFTTHRLRRIIGRCVGENAASRRVMEKCGMRPDGQETLFASDGNFHQGAFRDVTYLRFVLEAPAPD